jgi:hypothetical protein
MSREKIISAIQKCARKLGRNPSCREFFQQARISSHIFYRYFSSASEALRAAGLEPHLRGHSLEDSVLLLDWARVVRKLGHLPTPMQYRHEGRYDRTTIHNHFGDWRRLPAAFLEFSQHVSSHRRAWSDVLALIQRNRKAEKKKLQSKRSCPAAGGVNCHLPAKPAWRNFFKDRPVLGRPLHSCLPELDVMLCEPVNEAGVLFMFALLARRLGFRMESLQKGFPDCEVRREMQPGRSQRLRIEVEYESLNFLKHRHNPAACDVIVCWRHNWKDCPKNIEIVELRRLVGKK